VRILHLESHLGWGGQAQRVLLLLRGLAARGHEAALASPPGSELGRRCREAGIEVFDGCAFSRGFRPWRWFGELARLGRYLAASGPDVVHLHGSQDTWLGVLALRLRRVRTRAGRRPLVLRTKHNLYPFRRDPANRWLLARAVDHHVLVAEALRPLFRGLAPDARLSIIPSALPPAFAGDGEGGDRSKLRRELGLAGDALVVGSSARLEPDKGHADLLRAFARVADGFAGAHLVLAGDGAEEGRLAALAGELGLAERVHLLGFRRDIVDVTAAYDVAVLASLSEASSAALKEALALGVPAIASDVGGAREIVADGETGLVVPPGDVEALAGALRALLADPARRAAFGAAGRGRVRDRFSEEKLVASTEALYERLLAVGEGGA